MFSCFSTRSDLNRLSKQQNITRCKDIKMKFRKKAAHKTLSINVSSLCRLLCSYVTSENFDTFALCIKILKK